MILALLAVVGGSAIVRVGLGHWPPLDTLPLHARRLVVVVVAAQLAGGGLADVTAQRGWYVAGLVISALAGLGFCARNLSLAGVPLVTLGLAANALVVAGNGAMPVSFAAASRAGVATHAIAAGSDPRHRIAGARTTSRWLGDVIPVPFPVAAEVVSPGDVLVAAGLGELVVLAGRPRRRRHRDARSVDWPHGEEEAQAAGPGEEQGQPRQAPELLTPASRV